ncbi:MAG: NADPH:quinone oxidoreductase family protein [Actinomycetota bacterium]|jgi:NADPH2:quinone reductase
MRAVVCSSFAPLDQLVIEERASVPLAAGQVRVRVTAAGVNFVDALLVQGLYQIKPPLPFVPGGETVGIVTELGEGVTSHSLGDRVLITSGFGGFATEMVSAASRAVIVPSALTDGQAATFMQSYMTAYFALVHRAKMQPGQWLLVLGAGGGVGLAAVDVGRALGLKVIAAASSAAKREMAQSRGAVAVIDSSTDDVKARAKEISGDGVDAVYDPIGGKLGEECLRSLREDGQFIVIGFASGEIPKLPANQVLLRNRRVTGVDWGAWVGRNPAENQALVMQVLAQIAAGELNPVEPVSYPFEQAAQALADQQQRKVVGKAVLVP